MVSVQVCQASLNSRWVLTFIESVGADITGRHGMYRHENVLSGRVGRGLCLLSERALEPRVGLRRGGRGSSYGQQPPKVPLGGLEGRHCERGDASLERGVGVLHDCGHVLVHAVEYLDAVRVPVVPVGEGFS